MIDPAGLVENADQLCVLRRCEEAVALWETASSLKPANPEIHYQLGMCYSRDCYGKGLRDLDLAVYHYRKALSLMPAEDTLARAMALGDLGNTYALLPSPSETWLRASIDCFEQAAEIYRAAGKLDDWAREQFNLGNTWCEVSGAESPSKWEKAIRHFEQALSIRTREKDPRRHAATLQNLGTAYRELKTGNRAANICKAIRCYHQALHALRGPAVTRKTADLHHNLGNAYLNLALEGEDPPHNALRAVRHLTWALRVRTKAELPCDYAATQLSRGEAFLQVAIADLNASSGLDQARACFKDAREGFTQCGQVELADAAQKHLDRIAQVQPE